MLSDLHAAQLLTIARLMSCLISCSNKLSDLPDELAELQHLRVLRVKYNSLTKLPEVLMKMSKLEILELSGNQLTAVDDKVLAGLTNVRYPSRPSSPCQSAVGSSNLHSLPDSMGHPQAASGWLFALCTLRGLGAVQGA